jgi:uncharacterized coiled-coil protein SlyX
VSAALEDRVVELEVRVAFQEKLLGDLDDVLRALRDELDALRAAHLDLLERLDPSRADGGTESPAFDVLAEKPPHW